MVRYSCFYKYAIKYAMGAKGVDDLRHQGQIPFFQLCRGKKDKSGRGNDAERQHTREYGIQYQHGASGGDDDPGEQPGDYQHVEKYRAAERISVKSAVGDADSEGVLHEPWFVYKYFGIIVQFI